MKRGKLHINFYNEWLYFLIPTSWTTFTFIKCEMEDEYWLGIFRLSIVLLGFGMNLSFLYDESKSKDMLDEIDY